MGKQRMSKAEAFTLAKRYGIKFSGDFHADCDTSQGTYLAELARLVGYHKPKGATGSTGRYFYHYLLKYHK